MVQNPTMIIGVGEAGCRMASKTYDVIETEAEESGNEGILDRFKFVGIDTKADEVEQYTEDDFVTIALDPPHQYWKEDRDEFPYLRDDMTLADVGGATRQRGISRYYFDNLQNYSDIYQRLRKLVDDFESEEGKEIDSDEVDAANIWIINSLGGGTGSGAFPMLAGMLDQITSNAQEDYFLCGAGSLPRLDSLDAESPPPNANITFYANAYAALRELSVLLDYDFDDSFDLSTPEFPITIPIHAARKDGKLAGYGDITIDSPPFDFYGLIGFYEEEANESTDYKEDLNRVAADMIRLFSETMEEDFPDDYTRGQQGKPTLYSVDSRGIEVPVDDVQSYVKALERIDEINTRIEEAKSELERYRDNRDYITQLKDIDPGESVPDEDEEADDEDSEVLVDPGMVNTAREHAVDFVPKDRFNRDLLDEKFDNVLSETGTVSDRYEFETEDVVAYLYYKELERSLQSVQQDHRFVVLLEETIDRYSSKFDLYLGSSAIEMLHDAKADPLEKWEDGLEEFLEAAIEDQQEKYENTSRLKVIERREIKERIETLQERRSELTDEYIEYNNLDEAHSTARGRKQEARTTLDDVSAEVQDNINELRDTLDSLRTERGQRQNVQEVRREKLESYERERYVSIPFQDFENADIEFLSELSDINDLLEKGIITRRKLARAFEYQINHLEEPLQDLETYNVQVNPYRYLGVLISESNENLIQGRLDDIDGIDNVSSMLTNESEERERAIVEDPFGVRLTRAHADIALENTSEFGKIHTFYADEARTVGELLGSSSDDTELVATKFGYPEWFEEDERVQEAFGLTEEPKQATDD